MRLGITAMVLALAIPAAAATVVQSGSGWFITVAFPCFDSSGSTGYFPPVITLSGNVVTITQATYSIPPPYYTPEPSARPPRTTICPRFTFFLDNLASDFYWVDWHGFHSDYFRIPPSPIAFAQGVTTSQHTPVAITLFGTDLENDPLTYAIASPPSHGSLSGIAPNLVYTPNPAYSGADSFTFTVRDATFTSGPATVSITITSDNRVPAAIAQSVITLEDTPKLIALQGSDADGDPLTYAVATAPSKGTLSGTGSSRTYMPLANANGPDSFAFTVSDGKLTSQPATVSVNITPVNDAPIALPQSVSLEAAATVRITLAGSDVDGDTLAFSLAALPTHGTLRGVPPLLTYTPDNGYVGIDTFRFVANDAEIASPPAVVTLAIDAPVVSIFDATAGEGAGSVRVTVSLSRSSSAPVSLRYSTTDVTATAGSDYTPAAGTLTFAPGETTKSIEIAIVDDGIDEGDEVLTLSLGDVVNATPGRSQAYVRILDDDPPPLLTIGNVRRAEGSSGATLFTFDVTLSGSTSMMVIAGYATEDGTATAASGDYVSTAGQLLFVPGETSKTITVRVAGDVFIEDDETFQVNLVNVIGALPGGNGRGTILNDDVARRRSGGH